MSISNVRDPRDLLPDILRPGANEPAIDETAWVTEQTGIDGLRVWWNRERQKYLIEDTKAPGGPAAAFVMVVQFDGERTPIDQRTVDTLRRLYGRHQEQVDALARAEIERERKNKSRRESVAHAVATDLKWIGTNVVPSTGWRDRSAAREKIREAAQS